MTGPPDSMNASLKLLLLFTALAGIITAAPVSAEEAAKAPTVFMAGDSTMSDYAVTPGQTQRGWGQMLHMYFKDGVRVENHAMGGRSCRSFVSEGRWKFMIGRVKDGDYVIIQFGHNDEKKEDPKRYSAPMGDFKDFLTGFIKDVRDRGAHPVLVTPVSRRTFDKDGKTIYHSHRDFAVAVRQLAEAQKVPLLDLEARTSEEFEKMGPERSKAWFMWVPAGELAVFPEEHKDDTHFNTYGACRVCDLAVLEIKKNAPDLGKWIQDARVDPMKR
jgi:lysophospholipase L1-like esterase